MRSLTFSLVLQRQSGAKKLLYGASEVMNAAQFLKQVGSGVTALCLALYKLSDWFLTLIW